MNDHYEDVAHNTSTWIHVLAIVLQGNLWCSISLILESLESRVVEQRLDFPITERANNILGRGVEVRHILHSGSGLDIAVGGGSSGFSMGYPSLLITKRACS